jgi:hypothetical protein
MRASLLVVLLAAWMVCGCAGHRSSVAAPAGSSVVRSGDQRLIVTPERALVGKVIKVNEAGRFVVLNYSVGPLPGLELRLGLYRQGLKVGEVKVAGPVYEDNIVADIVAGEAAVGDEARNR